jgi:hypothetical protein
MNATNFTRDSVIDTNENPWVESGAMVYVAITVATMSAIIMCCTWFITQNKAFQRCRTGKVQYNGLDDDEEEEIQLTNVDLDKEDELVPNYTDNSEEKDVFTLADSSGSSEDEHQADEHQAV